MCEAGRDSPFSPTPFRLKHSLSLSTRQLSEVGTSLPQASSDSLSSLCGRAFTHLLAAMRRAALFCHGLSPGYRPQTKGIKRPQMKISRTVSPDKLSLLRSFSLAFPYRTRKMVTLRQSFLLSLPNLWQTSASVPNLYTIFFFACVILLKYTSSYKRPRSPHGTTSSRWFLYLKTVSYGWVCCFTLFLKLFKLLPWSCVWWWCLFSSPTSLWAPSAFRPERIPAKPWSIVH